jgi:hypothetical protein
MTPQQILDKVTDHLFTQGIASKTVGVENTHICAYRGENGTSCAVGCLIPDEDYQADMENVRIDEIVGQRPRFLPLDPIPVVFNNLPDYIRNNIDLLTDLQRVHDMMMPDYLVDDLTDTDDVILYTRMMKNTAIEICKVADSHQLLHPVHLIPSIYHPVD